MVYVVDCHVYELRTILRRIVTTVRNRAADNKSKKQQQRKHTHMYVLNIIFLGPSTLEYSVTINPTSKIVKCLQIQ